MSVVASKKTQPKFFVVVRAEDLAKYVLKITKNPKIFKVEYKEPVTDPIIATTLHLFNCVFRANKINVGTSKERFMKRQELQHEAMLDCENLLPMLELAQCMFHFKTKRLEYWSSRVIEVQTLIEAWKNSDRKRYNF